MEEVEASNEVTLSGVFAHEAPLSCVAHLPAPRTSTRNSVNDSEASLIRAA